MGAGMQAQAGMVYAVGECMIELQKSPDGAPGTIAYRFGGDTLNTAVYMARLLDPAHARVAYVTGLGTDGMSAEMLAAWEREGIDVGCVQRLPERLPGIYLIETDPDGERRFHYWRRESAARHWLSAPDAGQVLLRMATARLVVLSGISLAILADADRARLLDALAACRANGGSVAFDNNYRPRLWESGAAARAAYAEALHHADIALLTLDDEQALYGPGGAQEAIERARGFGVREVVVKCGAAAAVVAADGGIADVAPEPVRDVVDTTAAGDSFGAGYLAARLSGADPLGAARAGHRLAGTIIRHRGAIIPRDAMPGALF